MDTNEILVGLARGLNRDWRRRRDVDPATRREWVRLHWGLSGERANASESLGAFASLPG
jgi:hypothetical protein